ncbi:hypothetical protein HG536_0E02430 [Torulaspora globosa]|uniref:DNL-type domain-containing protein n=1 Tax=Torulaspora globosa TaxID=48254 RepID=A0A7G3ZIJ6_9SACH|nr:uncharacterized protein HG536_0E02430 [Torulaspora globosa]QLL33332.1 hypothetical protein HG536_0E02430 [Torulaspora globosa]
MLPRLVARRPIGSLSCVLRANTTALKSPLVCLLQRYTFTTSSAILSQQEEGNGAPDGSQKLGSFKVDKPMLMIAFTCKKCSTRSSHTMSKQAYTGGTVLITCPSCKNRHLIADHLKIFRDDRVTIEDILKAKGESVSSSTDDLVFEDIPKDLQSVIGHHARDAPEDLRRKLDNETIHALPENRKTD